MNLTVVNAQEDRANRGRVVMVLVVSLAAAAFFSRQALIGGVPGVMWALATLGGAFMFAWQSGMLARAHATLRLADIRREGLAATELLNAGDLAGAKAAWAALLDKARPLGAFHAVHVLMYGVTRFCEGDAKEGLVLASRALDSGWLTQRAVRDTAESWRALMLLTEGELAKVRALVEAMPGPAMVTPSIVLALREKEWDVALSRARAALAAPDFPAAGRATVAALGRFAAKKVKADVAEFDAVLARSPIGALAQKNPALRAFLER